MNTQNSMKNVVGEVQLSFKKYNSINASRISTSKDANAVFRELFPPNQISYREHFYVLYLNNSNHIMGYQLLSIGGITSTIVDIRIVLQAAAYPENVLSLVQTDGALDGLGLMN